MEKELYPVATWLLKHYKIEISKNTDTHDIVDKIAFHIDGLVHNVTSTAALVAMLNDSKKIETKHLGAVRMYIESKCKHQQKQSGGGPIASDFFGYPHPAYSPNNQDAGVKSSVVDFTNGIARPSMGPALEMKGGGNKTTPVASDVSKVIKKVLKHKHVGISKASMTELLSIVHSHLHCFASDLLKECPLTEKKLDKVLSFKRHAVFQ